MTEEKCDQRREGRRASDVEITTLTMHLSALQSDMGEIKASMKDMATAVTKLALVEERQVQSQQEMGRVFKALEKHDVRITALEQVASTATRTSDWVDRAVWACVAFSATLVAHKMGLL